jgi:hypothetical protein
MQFAHMFRAVVSGRDESPEKSVVAFRGNHNPRVAHLDRDDLVSSLFGQFNDIVNEVRAMRMAAAIDTVADIDATVAVKSLVFVHECLPDQFSNLDREFEKFVAKSWEILAIQRWWLLGCILSVRKVSARVFIGGDHANSRVGIVYASVSKLVGANVNTGRYLPKDSRNPSGREEVENILLVGRTRIPLNLVEECCRLRVDVVEQC